MNQNNNDNIIMNGNEEKNKSEGVGKVAKGTSHGQAGVSSHDKS